MVIKRHPGPVKHKKKNTVKERFVTPRSKLDQRIKKVADQTGPVWNGPEVDGVSQSMISRYLVCKERFRVYAIEGWAPNDSLRIPIEYGQMWHTCEEELAAFKKPWRGRDWQDNVEDRLREYCQDLTKRYRLPNEKEQIEKFYNACKVQFPIYADWWSKHPDVKERTPLLQEEVFNVPYKLPSGRVVRLRGKWDSVDLIGKGKKAGIYLQENKTKGRIDEEYLRRQLTFDLQTMTYVIALQIELEQESIDGFPKGELKGIRYNVVRRPFSGGRGDITRKEASTNPGDWVKYTGKFGGEGWKNKGTDKVVYQENNPGVSESKEDYYNRLQQYFIEDPKYWFMRWKVEIRPEDIQNFKDQFLDPCLEEMCLWYDLQVGKTPPEIWSEEHFKFLHYRLPYGVFNPILEGKGSDVEEYILSGSTAGLRKITNLFPELE